MRPRSKTALIVDDEESVRDLLSQQLKRLGYDSVAVPNGQNALEQIAGQEFDRAMGLELLRGRWFDGTETAESNRVVVVNQTLARTTWPASEAVGEQLRLGADEDNPIVTVIGVYADVSQMALRRRVSPEVYYPLSAIILALQCRRSSVGRAADS